MTVKPILTLGDPRLRLKSEPVDSFVAYMNELIEDLTRGNSWLSFARSAGGDKNSDAAKVAGGLAGKSKVRSTYQGKTYNSAEAIAEFFNKTKESSPKSEQKAAPPAKRYIKPPAEQNYEIEKSGNNFLPGAPVRHAKYGRGLVLRREGSGDNIKLTVSFPGFGQKKLMEKFAGLEPA